MENDPEETEMMPLTGFEAAGGKAKSGQNILSIGDVTQLFLQESGGAKARLDDAKTGRGGGADNRDVPGSTDEGQSSGVPKHAKKTFVTFNNFELSKAVLDGIKSMGYKTTTPIQRKTLEYTLRGKDTVAMARTGSGKSAAFIIPILEKLQNHSQRVGARAIILAPTRELALQIFKFTRQLGKYTDLRIGLLVGGESISAQFEVLSTNPDIIIGTPGRIMHLLSEVPEFSLKMVECIVFDEADRLFEMGFKEQLAQIMVSTPKTRQTMLFSATLPKQLAQFARAGLNNPELIRIDLDTKLSETLRIAFFTVRSEEKPAAALWTVRELIPSNEQCLIFAATKHHVEFLNMLFQLNGIASEPIYGAMDSSARQLNLNKFRQGVSKCRVLVVTDVASRGIDLPLLDNVINYDFPDKSKLFVHRCGRVARQNRRGTAFSLVAPAEEPYMIDLMSYLCREPSCGSQWKDDPDSCYSLEEMTANHVHYGGFPNTLMDSEVEKVKGFLDHHPELQSQYKTALNGYKMYNKTKGEASKRAVQEAKELNSNAIHPLLLQFVNTEEMSAVKFISQLSQFRPKQVVMEMDGSKQRRNTGMHLMQQKRNQHNPLVSNNSSIYLKEEYNNSSGEQEENGDSSNTRETLETTNQQQSSEVSNSPSTAMVKSKKHLPKKRLSVKQKRELKKGKSLDEVVESGKQKAKLSAEDFQDKVNYMSMEPPENRAESHLDIHAGEHSIQRLESSAFDMVPDEQSELNRRRKIRHWDTKKKKYVQVTVDELAEQRGVKRLKTDGGKVVRSDGQDHGQMYKKWQKRTKKSVQAPGAEEKNMGDARASVDWRKGSHDPRRLLPEYQTSKQTAESGANDEDSKKNELRAPEDIAKLRTEQFKKKVKNMKGGMKTAKQKGLIKNKKKIPSKVFRGAPPRSKTIVKTKSRGKR